MQLTPRYGADPLIVLEGPPGAVGPAVVRQRRRMADTVAGFGPAEWSHPSRCEGWSNRDVVLHLESTNTFWAFSIRAGLAGEPTRFLASFDPVASPAQLVAESQGLSSAEVLERFVASTDALAALLESLGEEDWTRLAEGPPGHLAIDAVAHHALWDSWVHERDVLVPLGQVPVEDAEEIAACLRYAAALGPAFALSLGRDGIGSLVVHTSDPEIDLVVEVDGAARVRSGDGAGEPDLHGSAVDVLESLSLRRPFDHEVPVGSRWMLSGLAEVFDASPVPGGG